MSIKENEIEEEINAVNYLSKKYNRRKEIILVLMEIEREEGNDVETRKENIEKYLMQKLKLVK